MAIFFNVYDKFFSSISVALVRANLVFTFAFLFGWFLGLFGFSNAVLFLYENYGQLMSFCFIGLILGCVPRIVKKAGAGKTSREGASRRALNFRRVGNFHPIHIVIFLVSLAIILLLAFNIDSLNSGSGIPDPDSISASLLIWLFAASLISASAMLIPGVGGSLMMLVFGIYTIYIEAVATLNPLILSVLVPGMIVGVLTGIVLTKKLLMHFSQGLYCSILAFIIGSLFIIKPGFSFDLEGLLSIVFAFLCAALTYWLSKKDRET